MNFLIKAHLNFFLFLTIFIENETCETIGGYLIIIIGFIIYMIIFIYSLKWDLETKEWDFIDVQDDDDFIVEIILTLFQLIFCGNYTC